MTSELLRMSEWVASTGITHIAMESTGEYWKPVYNVLESSYDVIVVNSHHFKQVPGRKTDVKDAEWLADLLRHGLVRGSFIPPLPQRDLRDLTRQRTTLKSERASVINRLQKVLEWANIKLASVVTDISGVSARRMLKEMVEGTDSPEGLAALVKGRLCRKQPELIQALTGQVREHHRFLLQTHLEHLEFLEQQIVQFDQRIEQLIQAQSSLDDCSTQSDSATGQSFSWQQAMALLDTILWQNTAE